MPEYAGTSMTIRRQPGDFRVDERADAAWLGSLSSEPSTSHPHAVYHLVKESLTTPEACAKLARVLGVAPGRVEYAGLKDKHARTRQHVSISPPGPERAAKPASGASLGEGDAWSATLLGYAAEAVTASIIAGNEFCIIVRSLTGPEADAIAGRANLLRVQDRDDGSARLLMTNYFGDQRFGSARHGAGFAARRLIDGDFEGALRLLIATPARKDSGTRRTTTRTLASAWGRWQECLGAITGVERHAVAALASGRSFVEAFAMLPHSDQAMCVEAYQSFIWNSAARELTRSLGGQATLVASDDFGEMCFAPGPSVADDLHAMTMPLPASGVRLQQPWGASMEAALHAEGLTMERLSIPGVRRPAFRSVLRPLLAIAGEVEIGPIQRDEFAAPRSPRRFAREVSFVLPRGAYATVLLRALGQ